MKSIQTEKKSNWKKINKVVLRVDSIDLHFDEKENIIFYCGFENISRGRCKLSVLEKKKKLINNLFIHNDKALMEVKVYYISSKIEKLIRLLSHKKNTQKIINVTLEISDSLLINQNGDLYINDNTKVIIDKIYWSIPIL